LTTAASEQQSLTSRSLDHGSEADPPGPARLPDLASAALGGTVVFASDELFADARNLVTAAPAAHDPAAFGPRGKVYDGWETRRRREAGSDFVIVRLAAPAIVRAVNIDTSFFTGNFPPYASVEAATVMGYPSPAEVLAAAWTPLLGRTRLRPDTGNVHPVTTADRLATHVRLTIYPDGGVARLRVYGEVVPDPRRLGGRVDLAASLHGAVVSGCSNVFYSSPLNVLAPGRAAVMSDGWETAATKATTGSPFGSPLPGYCTTRSSTPRASSAMRPAGHASPTPIPGPNYSPAPSSSRTPSTSSAWWPATRSATSDSTSIPTGGSPAFGLTAPFPRPSSQRSPTAGKRCSRPANSRRWTRASTSPDSGPWPRP
jgi:allantoicase